MAVKYLNCRAWEVQALLAGTRFQARRVLKPQPPTEQQFPGSCFGLCPSVADGVKMYSVLQYDSLPKHPTDWDLVGSVGVARRAGFPNRYRLPFAPGDLLYVREAYRTASWDEDGYCWLEYQADKTRSAALHAPEEYLDALCADLNRRGAPVDGRGNYTGEGGILPRVHPSIHMPRWASRMTLEVGAVRAHRVQDISAEDAIVEGIDRWMTAGEARAAGGLAWGKIPEDAADDAIFWIADYDPNLAEDADRAITLDPREAYRALWNSLHGEGAWDRNDWVAACTFLIHDRNVDDLLRERGQA